MNVVDINSLSLSRIQNENFAIKLEIRLFVQSIKEESFVQKEKKKTNNEKKNLLKYFMTQTTKTTINTFKNK